MMRSRTLRSAARLLVGTLLAAYAMVSLQVNALAAPAPAAPSEAVSSHCHEDAAEAPAAEPGALLCKHHCQSEVQTLDHPVAKLAAMADAGWLAVPPAVGSGDAAGAAAPRARPHATHHGGAPPPFLATLRLRI